MASASIIILLALAAPVAAEEPARSFAKPLSVYAAAAAADLATSYYCSPAAGCVEGNPLINWIEPYGHTRMLVVGEAMDVAAIWTAHRLLSKKHPKLLRVGLYAVAGVRFGIAARNVQQRRRIAARMALSGAGQ